MSIWPFDNLLVIERIETDDGLNRTMPTFALPFFAIDPWLVLFPLIQRLTLHLDSIHMIRLSCV